MACSNRSGRCLSETDVQPVFRSSNVLKIRTLAGPNKNKFEPFLGLGGFFLEKKPDSELSPFQVVAYKVKINCLGRREHFVVMREIHHTLT